MRARLVDAGGAEVATETRVLGRVLVDASGSEVPFWRATKVGSDTRIAPGGTWQDTLALPAAAAGTVEVDVIYRGVSEAVAKQLSLKDVEEHAMSSAKVPLAKLPRTVTVAPPAAGKRPTKAAP